MNDLANSSAIISACGTYRYRLEREGRGDGATAVIMVNPSTADATLDDPTIRKLRGFGDRYGCLKSLRLLRPVHDESYGVDAKSGITFLGLQVRSHLLSQEPHNAS